MIEHISAAVARHDRIALQVSGGRDSLACLHLLRGLLDRITVYWLNTGSAYPETIKIMEGVRAMCPHFVEVAGHQPQVVAMFGMPSDIVPVSHTPGGLFASGVSAPLIQDRYSCCYRSIMAPLHARMIEDGITLVIRGQKDADPLKSPLQSGAITDDGIELLYPLANWTATDVDDYLVQCGVDLPPFYKTMNGSPDCMTCTAWWEEGAVAYLAEHHPEQHDEVQRRLTIINDAVAVHVMHFNRNIAIKGHDHGI